MQNAEPVFYFSLPRLFARWRGGSDARTEMNWLETNVVGAAVHAVVYLFIAHLLLGGLPMWQQALWLLPLAAFVLLAWLIVLHANSLVVKLLRACGLMRTLPNHRAQSILIGIMTTAFACELLRAGSWLGLVGGIWLAAVILNLTAALALALSPGHGSPAR